MWVNINNINLRFGSLRGRIPSFNECLPGFLNALFTVRQADRQLYKLVHVSLLQVSGDPTPHRPEGMCGVEEITYGGIVMPLSLLEGPALLIPLEPTQKWIVNNRMDYNAWNTMHDGE